MTISTARPNANTQTPVLGSLLVDIFQPQPAMRKESLALAADSQPQLFPADQRAVAVDLVLRAVPKLDNSAYLEARFIHEEDLPIQAGTMQFYRDGAFIGSRHVPEFLPREALSLPFGKDERVRVETQPEEEQSRAGGLLRRSAVDDHRVRYQLPYRARGPVNSRPHPGIPE